MTQVLLCQPPVKTGGARPASSDPDMIEAGIRKLLPDVLGWFAGHGETVDESDHQDIIDDIRSCRSWSGDGFDTAYNLKSSKHWECDADLVEILSNLDGYIRDAVRAATVVWIEADDVRPKYRVGDRVTVRDTIKKLTATGEIYEINRRYGEYYVRVEEWGHIRDRSGKTLGVTGSIYKWEQVEEWNA